MFEHRICLGLQILDVQISYHIPIGSRRILMGQKDPLRVKQLSWNEFIYFSSNPNYQTHCSNVFQKMQHSKIIHCPNFNLPSQAPFPKSVAASTLIVIFRSIVMECGQNRAGSWRALRTERILLHANDVFQWSPWLRQNKIPGLFQTIDQTIYRIVIK